MKKKKSKRKPRYTLAKVLCGLFFTIAGAFSLQTYFAFESTAVHGTGIVKDIERHMHKTGRRGGSVATVRPLIEFTPMGFGHTIKTRTESEERDNFEVGQEVKVEYQPTLPDRTLRIDAGLPPLDTVVAVIGMALLASAIWRTVQWRMELKSRQSLVAQI